MEPKTSPLPQPMAMYIAPAQTYPQLWRLLLGLGVLVFCYVGFMALMAVIAYPVLGPLRYFGWLSGLMFPATPGHVLFLLATFIGMMVGAFLAASACHFRGPSTLLGPKHRFVTGFLTTVAMLIPIYLVMTLYQIITVQALPNLDLARWLSLLPLALPLVLIQVSAEELIFRGYLMQQLAARFRSRWVWMALPATLFALLHYNPAAGNAAWPVVGVVLIFAVIAADLTARTGSLGAAIGLHFVNNCFALLVLSVDGTITGLSLYITPFTIAEAPDLGRSTIVEIALLFLIWRLLYRRLRD